MRVKRKIHLYTAMAGLLAMFSVAVAHAARPSAPLAPGAAPRLSVRGPTADRASEPTACCTIAGIDARRGVVSARETASGRMFTFTARDRNVLRGLRVGQPVYANFETKRVSLDAKTACCTIQHVATAKPPVPGESPAASKNRPSGTTAPKKQTTTVEVPKVEVAASEGSTATAMRGRPATPATAAKQPVPGTTPASLPGIAGAVTTLPQAGAGIPPAVFDAKKHGFEFANYFTGDILVDLPLIGRVDLGDTAYGLCGGMVFAALDTFKFGAFAPDVPITPPPSGTPMRSYLYQRQMDSLRSEDWFLVRRLVAWMRKPLNDNTVPNPLAEGGVNVIERGLIHLSKKEFTDKIRPSLDAGRPVTIVLVKASGEDMVSNPKAAFSKNHQVLATGYRRHGDEWDIDVYDPNFPNTIQTLHVDGRHQTQKGSTSHTGKFRGFFHAPYKLDRPPWVQDSPAVAGRVRSFPVGRFPRGDSDN